jgi:dynein heavy chain
MLVFFGIQTLENTDFTDVRPLFPPLMHTVCLVYSHSTYYNSAARIIVLMQVSLFKPLGT